MTNKINYICSDDSSTNTSDFKNIEKGADDLMKSVQNEIKGYQKQLNNLLIEEKKTISNIDYEHDQKILQIF